MDVEIFTTADGSHSLRNIAMNETYHSHHGARQESMHVFIRNGLDYFFKNSEKKNVAILEVGFGTGLNALLTLLSCASERTIHFTTLEAFPLDESIWSQLNYGEASVDEGNYFRKIHQAQWNHPVTILPFYKIEKVRSTLQAIELADDTFDIIFYDAFAPSKQPDMWTLPLLEKIVNAMRPSGIFVTYCAKGQLKRDLKSLGLRVETLPGPPGKFQMVRALKSE